MSKRTYTINVIETDQELADFYGFFRVMGYEYHHTAIHKGYVSRLTKGYTEPYIGRFGLGYKFHKPCEGGTQYHKVEYWIRPEGVESAHSKKED